MDPEEGPGLQKGQHLQPHPVQEAYVMEAEIISLPTRIQEAIIFRRGNDQILVLLCSLCISTKI
jgi:hypothetical protein